MHGSPHAMQLTQEQGFQPVDGEGAHGVAEGLREQLGRGAELALRDGPDQERAGPLCCCPVSVLQEGLPDTRLRGTLALNVGDGQKSRLHHMAGEIMW